jgi:hypothetical protein
MSHHYSGPDYGFPHGDARLDLTDLYVFPKPGDAGKSILVMDVHPSESVSPPGPTTTEPFSHDAVYEIKIDTDGDLMADIAFRIRFSPFENDAQTATLRVVRGADAAGTGDEGETLVDAAPVSIGAEAHATQSGEYRLFAGWRSDPFFFDTLGALNDMQFTGTDFFAGKDVCSIVLEVPNTALGNGRMNLWARTVDGRDGRWVQAERGARPSQSVFLTGSEKSAYFAAGPAQDDRFIAVYAHSLEHTGGYTPEEATRVAKTLLPDVIRYDASLPAHFPDNGRALLDDVMDGFIFVLTNGKVLGDDVGAHADLLEAFPYLGPPHRALPAAATQA